MLTGLAFLCPFCQTVEMDVLSGHQCQTSKACDKVADSFRENKKFKLYDRADSALKNNKDAKAFEGAFSAAMTAQFRDIVCQGPFCTEVNQLDYPSTVAICGLISTGLSIRLKDSYHRLLRIPDALQPLINKFNDCLQLHGGVLDHDTIEWL